MYTIVVGIRTCRTTGREVLAGHEFVMMRNLRRNRLWELPGGRAEPGEDPTACARREFSEETGRAIGNLALALRRVGELGEGYVFLGDAGAQKARPRESEIAEVGWFRALPAPAELSFPDDPYEETFRAARRLLEARARAGPADR